MPSPHRQGLRRGPLTTMATSILIGFPASGIPRRNYTTANYSPDYAATVTAGIQAFMGSAVATMHFVIDTSRNGKGH